MWIVSGRPYLSYYGDQGIIPVHQDTSDLDRQFACRRALYRQLSIPPLLTLKRRIIEFGPGTGDNALYFAACEPDLLVLVDANPASLQAISEKREQGSFGNEAFECHASDILEYRDSRAFDLVICEGVIPG